LHAGVGVANQSRQLVQRPLGHLPGPVVGHPPHRLNGDDQARSLVARQPQRPPHGSVAQVHPTLAAGDVEIDIDQVVRQATRQPAHHQHCQVGQHLLFRDAEVAGDVRHLRAIASRQVRHQRQQAQNLGRPVHGVAPNLATSAP